MAVKRSKADKTQRFLGVLRGRVDEARRFRRSEGYDDLWRRMIDLYRGKQFPIAQHPNEDRIVINVAKATIDAIVPSVAMNVPNILVTAKNSEDEDSASIAEAVLNYQFKHHEFKKPMNSALMDSLIMGLGVVKVGWKFIEEEVARHQTEMDDDYAALIDEVDRFSAENPDLADSVPTDQQVASQIPTKEMKTVADHPIVERVSPFDVFIDPSATSIDEATWIAHRFYRTKDEVQEDSRYNKDIRMKLEPTHSARNGNKDDAYRSDNFSVSRDKDLVCIWEYWDLVEGFMAVFPEHGDGFLIDPQEQPYKFGCPFVFLQDTQVPEVLYPMGQLEAIEHLQHELNKTRSQLMNHRKKHARKYVYDAQAFSKASIAQLQSDQDNVMVPVEDGFDPGKAIMPIQQTPVTADLYQARDQILEDVQLISGRNEYQMNVQGDRRKTATEASIMSDTARNRANYKISQYEEFSTAVARKVLQLDQEYMTGQQAAFIVGRDGATYWFQYQPQDIVGEFHFEVEAGSTTPVDMGTRKREALDMMNALAPLIQMGVLDPVAIAEKVLKAFGEKSPSRFIAAPPAQQGMPPGAPGVPPAPGGQPGMGPSAPQATPRQAAEQGVSPEMMSMLSGQQGLQGIQSPDMGY